MAWVGMDELLYETSRKYYIGTALGGFSLWFFCDLRSSRLVKFGLKVRLPGGGFKIN